MDIGLRQACNEIDAALMYLSGQHTQKLSVGIGKMLDYIHITKSDHTEIIEPVGRLRNLVCRMSDAGKGAEIRFEVQMERRVDDLAGKISVMFERSQSFGPVKFTRQTSSEDCKRVARKLSAALDEFGDTEFIADRINGVVFLRKCDAPMSKAPESSDNSGDQQLTPDEILPDYPRFRLLIIGKNGTGKSTLINQVKLMTTADYMPGRSDINKEITSPDHNRFILHDSMGFGAGELENLGVVTDFIRKRNLMPDLQSKVHAIWLCLPIPYAGGRLLESADENFLKLDFGVPVIAVFTKFDIIQGDAERIVRRHPDASKWSSEELRSRLDKAMDDIVEERCAKPLQKLGRTIPHAAVSKSDKESLEKLMRVTYDTVKLVSETLSISWGLAQRANFDWNVDSRIKQSIRIGSNAYWGCLSTSILFKGKKLKECLVTIHDNIVNVWNFLDPDMHLRGEHFKECMLHQIADLIEFDRKWLYNVYMPTPETLRVLMGYIVDLTLILKSLVLVIQAQSDVGPHPATRKLIKQVLTAYGGSEDKAQGHLVIKNDTSIFQRKHPDKALEDITKLIYKEKAVRSGRWWKNRSGWERGKRFLHFPTFGVVKSGL